MRFNSLKYLLILPVFAGFGSFAQNDKGVSFRSPQEMQDFFRYRSNKTPLVFAHRGGAMSGFPENCIATYQHTLKTVTAFFEIDPRFTKDSVMVILHDDTLDRTTNGKGKLSDYTWGEVKKLRLKDPLGNVTAYPIPTFDEVINWARGKAVLMIDKKDVPLKILADRIKTLNATTFVIVSAYDAGEAEFHYGQNKDIMLEAFITNEKSFTDFEETGIPARNMIAYVSQPKTREFYDRLHKKGISCMVYTSKVIEKQPETERLKEYAAVISGGADMILSDKVGESSAVVYRMRTN